MFLHNLQPSLQPSPAKRERGLKTVSKLTTTFLLALPLIACAPKYDWRDVHGDQAPYTVLMPNKPARLSREIQLGDEQQTVTMHMTAAQIDGVKFAVGAVKMPDATQAQTALAVIKNALVNNMAGKITQEKMTVTNVDGKLIINDDFDAINASIRMSGRLVARDVWAYEVLVVGPQQAINQDAVDTFLSSFKPI